MTPAPYYQDDHVTLYHGDCREILAWLAGDVLVTDPPYGMALRMNRGGRNGDLHVAGDEDTSARDEALDMWGKRPAVVFGRWSIERPPSTRMVLTWDKGEAVGAGAIDLPWKPVTEEIYILGSGFSGHRGSCVLRYQPPLDNRVHPTQKPVELMRNLIGKCPDGIIADPFAGSGSTLRAAKDLGRKAIGVELDERHCEQAANRLGQEVLDFGGVA